MSKATSFGTQTYSYDKIYELTEVDYPSFYSFSDMTYYYDSTWNRTTTVNGGTTTYVTNSLNQCTSVGGTSFTHDTNGNLTSDGVQTYYYDCENHLTKVVRNSDGQTLGEYKYDPFGRRFQKIAGGTTTNYVYDQTRYQVLAEYEDSGGGFSLARHFVYGAGIDEPVVMHQNDTYYYYHRDGLGSVVNLTDSSGSTVETYYYDIYGDFSSSGSLSGNPYAFTGRRYDSENKLFYYRARYYNSEIGRFLQLDSIDCKNNLNLYTYVQNSPINSLDPLGSEVAPDATCDDLEIDLARLSARTAELLSDLNSYESDYMEMEMCLQDPANCPLSSSMSCTELRDMYHSLLKMKEDYTSMRASCNEAKSDYESTCGDYHEYSCDP